MLTQRRLLATICCGLAAFTVAACSSSSGSVSTSGSTSSPAAAGGVDSSDPSATGTKTTGNKTGTAGTGQRTGGSHVQLAFGGDVHFAGASAAGLSGNLGSAMSQLKAADIAMVNLETAITNGGTPAPKKYTFRAPPVAMDVLHKSGIDVVTIANNHGMDYGRVGLADTLAASKEYGLPVIGAGADVTAAYTPYRKTVRGVRVSILAATDVLDTFAIPTWPATATQSGLASAKDPALLLAAVRNAAATSDIVVVDLHWGVELRQCPTPEQVQLFHQLTAAGADVVVGSHAHVLGPNLQQGRTAVDFGLGNFVFYAHAGVAAQSGVFTVTVDRGGVLATKFTPAIIEAGRPRLLTGSAATTAATREAALAHSCTVS